MDSNCSASLFRPWKLPVSHYTRILCTCLSLWVHLLWTKMTSLGFIPDFWMSSVWSDDFYLNSASSSPFTHPLSPVHGLSFLVHFLGGYWIKMSLKWQDLIFNSENLKNKSSFFLVTSPTPVFIWKCTRNSCIFVTDITKKHPWGKRCVLGLHCGFQ